MQLINKPIEPHKHGNAKAFAHPEANSQTPDPKLYTPLL